MLGVAAGGKVVINAPGEKVLFNPLHPTWLHVVYPASADLMLAQFGLGTTASLEIEMASGSVWHSRASPSGRLAPPILRPPSTQAPTGPLGPASQPARGPHRPPSRRLLDDLIRAHDQTVPPNPRPAPADSFALATQALGRRVNLFAPHLVHAFAWWLEASLRAELIRTAQRCNDGRDMQIAMRATVWMLGEIRVGQYADRDRAQLDSLLTELQISPQTRRTHPFLQWADVHTSPDFDGRNPLGVIPGSRAARPEARRALGRTSHRVGDGTQAALDVVVARIRADLSTRQRPAPTACTPGER